MVALVPIIAGGYGSLNSDIFDRVEILLALSTVGSMLTERIVLSGQNPHSEHGGSYDNTVTNCDGISEMGKAAFTGA